MRLKARRGQDSWAFVPVTNPKSQITLDPVPRCFSISKESRGTGIKREEESRKMMTRR